jgi:hypothetical protein
VNVAWSKSVALVVGSLDRYRLEGVEQVSQWICRYGKDSEWLGRNDSLSVYYSVTQQKLLAMMLGWMLLGQDVHNVSMSGSPGDVARNCRKGR